MPKKLNPHFLLPPEYVLSYLYGQMKQEFVHLIFNPAMGLRLESIFIMPSNLGFGGMFLGAIRKG